MGCHCLMHFVIFSAFNATVTHVSWFFCDSSHFKPLNITAGESTPLLSQGFSVRILMRKFEVFNFTHEAENQISADRAVSAACDNLSSLPVPALWIWRIFCLLLFPVFRLSSSSVTCTGMSRANILFGVCTWRLKMRRIFRPVSVKLHPLTQDVFQSRPIKFAASFSKLRSCRKQFRQSCLPLRIFETENLL